MSRWTAADIPDQTGRTIIVTGANSGLGEQTATRLAEHGATLVLACRDTARGEAAAERMRRTATGSISVRRLDLADLASVRAFAAALDSPVDVLVNNAGIMAPPLKRTADGFELQFGTNFLGHFALTGLLLPHLRDRVVTLSSGMHLIGRIDLGDPNYEHRRYRRWPAYGQSKLADLMFAYELQRRLDAAGSTVRSYAAHPGYASTELQSHTESVQDSLMALGNRVIAQSAAMGALPALYAASMPDLPGGAYYGPDRELRGYPKRTGSSKASRDRDVAQGLWELAETLTRVTPL